MPVMLTDPTGLLPGCGLVEKRDYDQNQQQDSKTGGPSTSETDDDAANPDPQHRASGCGAPTPCEYTFAGCEDPLGGGAGSQGGIGGMGWVGPFGFTVPGGGGEGGPPDWEYAMLFGPVGPDSCGSVDPDGSIAASGGCLTGDPARGGGGDNISQLRLVLSSDCLDSNGRFLAYQLWNVVTNSAPSGNYTVTENFRDWPSDAGAAPNTSSGPNAFIDVQGTLLGLPGGTFNSLQHFTIGGPGVSGNPTVPVRWNSGQDYGELGIWRAVPPTGSPYGIVLINGTQAATKAPVGTKCKDDPF
jgi:hypothetical protein